MRDLRNPFRLQAAQYIESAADFLRLFGPGALDLLPQSAPFTKPLFIRSAPGGGKTSILRLFTPPVLTALVALRAHPDYRDLFNRLRDLEVVTHAGPSAVGVMLQCGRTFPDLADLGLGPARSKRLLFALLDARIMLGALKSALAIRQLRYPDDLDRITVGPLPDSDTPVTGLSLPCSGRQAQEWAEAIERGVCDLIDSFDEPSGGPSGHERLEVLDLLGRGTLRVDGAPPGVHWLVLLDDVEKLVPAQRSVLRETILEERQGVAVWIAERLEALTSDELLGSGALAGRDYDAVVNLEEYWRESRRFESVVAAIAERRARVAAEVDPREGAGSFAAVVDPPDDPVAQSRREAEALEVVARRVRQMAREDARYSEWVSEREREQQGAPTEQLVAWRSLEILIERHRRKRQLSLDLPLPAEDLREKEGSDVRGAAVLFLAEEFGFPYYFGPTKLASLGSFNMEQYLKIAGDLFEESLAQLLLRRPPHVPAERQEEILKDAYDTRVLDIPRRFSNGRDVLLFLQLVGTFCHEVTYQPNAPYAPGVNGVAISMQERALLLDPAYLATRPAHRRFAEMLATALAQNLLHADLDRSVKGQRWMILYLNRLLCPRYGLPLGFGGFRERPLSELVAWLERGTRPPLAETLAL